MTSMETRVMVRKIVLMFLLVVILLGIIYQMNSNQKKIIYVFPDDNLSVKPSVETPQGVQANLHKQVDSLMNDYENRTAKVRSTVIP